MSYIKENTRKKHVFAPSSFNFRLTQSIVPSYGQWACSRLWWNVSNSPKPNDFSTKCLQRDYIILLSCCNRRNLLSDREWWWRSNFIKANLDHLLRQDAHLREEGKGPKALYILTLWTLCNFNKQTLIH